MNQGPYPPHYHPPQPGFQPPTINVIAPPAFGPDPVRMTCPNCRNTVTSTTESTFNTTGWIAFGVLCIVFFPCACIPCCVQSCHNVEHSCPSCRAYLGTYKS